MTEESEPREHDVVSRLTVLYRASGRSSPSTARLLPLPISGRPILSSTTKRHW